MVYICLWTRKAQKVYNIDLINQMLKCRLSYEYLETALVSH